MIFKSEVLIHPGLNNSGEKHWQTLWEKRYPQFVKVNQKEWDNPVCSEWISHLDNVVQSKKEDNVVIVGHSLACATIAFWSREFKRKIKGALLVAPSDTEADSYPDGTTGFKPMPLVKLPFPSITVMSSNDKYVSIERAKVFANAWGSDLVNIGNAGHINAESDLGFWEFGLELLDRLDH
jgi:predicted alpha/beta hydrolase family esterase